jgi:hypothetical protein
VTADQLDATKVTEAINEAIDYALDEYARDRQAIISEAERKAAVFRGRDRRLALWSRSRGCIFRGCKRPSVKSHSIQKNGPLLAVSRAGVVLAPQFDLTAGEVRLVERGLRQASVFPGFCETHEAMFKPFEEAKDLRDVDHIWLQTYRTICREVLRLETEVECARALVRDYSSVRNQRVLGIAAQRLGAEWLKRHDVTLKSLDFDSDPALGPAQEREEELQAVLAELKSEHLAEIESLLPDRLGEAVGPFAFVIDVVLPVALSGLGTFAVIQDGRRRQVVALLGVFPNIESATTTLVMHGKAADAPVIDAYLRTVRTPLDAIEMVERWMIRGTDHWFLDPDVWQAKDPTGQHAILLEMLDFSKGITHPVDVSLFDELRARALKE